MTLLSLLMVAFGLSMDAFAVSVTNGISMKEFNLKNALKIALFMGGFQGIMPIIGWVAGIGFKDYITKYDHWIALILLSIIGVKMIYESIKEKRKLENSSDQEEENELFIACGCEEGQTDCSEEKQCISTKVLLLLAVATSIDALAVGISFAFLQINILTAALTIGIITFVLSFIGVKLGKKCGNMLQSKAEIAGGIILILIGVKIFLEHTGIL